MEVAAPLEPATLERVYEQHLRSIYRYIYSKVGNREALLDRLWSVLEALPDPQLPRPSKQAAVIALLRRPEGATVDEVKAATGWQSHTVRGVFSGALKKKLGLAVVAAKEERGRVYRIAEAGA